MRILYALDTYRPNIDGVAISSERFAQGLRGRGHDVAVVAPGHRMEDYVDEVDGLPVYRVKALRFLSERWWLPVFPSRGVESAIEDFRPDLVTVTLPFLLSRAAVSVAKRHSIPLVGITGTMPQWLTANLPLPRGVAQKAEPALWDYIAGYYDQCDAVVGVTRTALDMLLGHGLDRPGYVISNGVSLTRFRPREKDVSLARRLKLDARPVVLYAGRLDAEKRMDKWLKGAAALKEMGVEAQYLIVGNGSERDQMKSDAEDLGIAEDVIFSGFLDDEDYARTYSLASAFAITSPAELQSIVTLEAAASGLPIVAVNAGALPELVDDGGNGFLFEDGDAEGMALALARVLRDQRAAARMGKNSRAIAERHGIDRSIGEYEHLFSSLVSKHGSRDIAALT